MAQWKEPEKGLGMGPDVKVILSCAKSYRTTSPTQAVNPDKRQDLEKGQREGRRRKQRKCNLVLTFILGSSCMMETSQV